MCVFPSKVASCKSNTNKRIYEYCSDNDVANGTDLGIGITCRPDGRRMGMGTGTGAGESEDAHIPSSMDLES